MVKGNINSRSVQPILPWSDIKAGDGKEEKNITHCRNSEIKCRMEISNQANIPIPQIIKLSKASFFSHKSTSRSPQRDLPVPLNLPCFWTLPDPTIQLSVSKC